MARGIIPENRPVFDTKDVGATALDGEEFKFLRKYTKDQKAYLDELTLKEARELNRHLDRELELIDNKKRAILAAKHTIEENFRGN